MTITIKQCVWVVGCCAILSLSLPVNSQVEATVKVVETRMSEQAVEGTSEDETKKDENQADEKSSAESQALNSTISELEALKGGGVFNSINEPLLEQSIRFVKYLLTTNRKDQDAVHEFARTINRNLDNCLGCGELVDEIRSTNKLLISQSYTDSLLQNGNLSNQIESRLGNLVKDSVLLQDTHKRALEAEFKYEYQLLAKRYDESRRFRFGLGLSNTYLPTFNYQGQSQLDFSGYQSEISGGNDRLVYNETFGNEVSNTLVLSADTPILKLNASFPNVVKSERTELGVRRRDIDERDSDMLYRTSIDTAVEIDYDVGAVFEYQNLAEFTSRLAQFVGFSPRSKKMGQGQGEDSQKNTRRAKQTYWGFGFGMTGIQVTDTISNDIKFTTADSAVFNDLPTTETQVFSDNKSFLVPYLSLSYVIEISDEFKTAIEARWYVTPDSRRITIDDRDIVVSLQAIWYPTFPW